MSVPSMEGYELECPTCGLIRGAKEAVAAGRDCPECGTDLSQQGIPREKPERIRYTDAVLEHPELGTRLPVRHPNRPYYEAELGRASCVFTTYDGEVRIPSIHSHQQGDMSRLLDKLMADLDAEWVRFVNLSPPGVMEDYLEDFALEIGADNPRNVRPLRDVVHGFTEEVEVWDHLPPGTTTSYEGRDSQECICLVGRWERDA